MLRFKFTTLIVFIVLLTVWLGASAYLAHNLCSPKRRPLQDYHRSWTDNPSEHGIKLKPYTAKDGTPVLVVEADASPAKRGQTIRSQIDSPCYFGEIHANLYLLHGRKGRKEDLLPVAERLCAVGFRCILIDLPAHGEHPTTKNFFATTDTEAQLIDTIRQELHAENDWEGLPTHLWGMSMGGAYVNKTLQLSHTDWGRAIIICSFDNLDHVVSNQLNKAGPLKFLMRAGVSLFMKFDPITSSPVDWVSSVNTPVMVAHGDDDNLISLEQGQRLFSSYPSKNKKFIQVEGADHNNILITNHPLYAEMATWLLTGK